jgi:hypothetical protein
MGEALTIVVTFVLGLLAGALADRRGWKHENKTRWLADKRKVYAEFLNEVDIWCQESFSAAGWRAASVQDEYRDDNKKRVEAIESRRDNSEQASRSGLAEIELLAGQDVIAAAKDFRAAAHEFIGCAREYPPTLCGGAHPDVVDADHEMQRKRLAYVEATRSELGVGPFLIGQSAHDAYAHGRDH